MGAAPARAIRAAQPSSAVRGRLAITAAGLIAALLAFTLFLHTQITGDWTGDLVLFTAIVPAPLLAGLLITLRTDNVIGPLLLGHALMLALLGLAGPYAQYALIDEPGSLPGGRWAAVWVEIGWPTLYAGLVAVALVFPDGRLGPGRWRTVAVAAGISFVGLILTLAVTPGDFSEPFQGVERPLPVLPDGFPPVFVVFWLGTLASLVAGVVAVRSRFRRATGRERRQLLWLAYGALTVPAALVVSAADILLTTHVTWQTPAAVMVTELAVPVSIGVAILRYRLFDIELVLSRTLVYGVLTVCVVAVYVAVVGGLSSIVGSRGLLGLVATGIVAIGIQPFRSSLQQRVDRVVYGDRDDPYAALARLGDRLQATPAPEAVTESIVETVAEALRGSYVALEFDRDGRFEIVAAHGADPGGGGEVLPLVYQGQAIGRLTVRPSAGRELNASDRRLLADLARHAGVALHGVRLTADLQRAREGLVSTREEERRRLRRDLHDSLGPTLAGMAFRLDAAGQLIDSDPEGAALALRDLRHETQDAIGEIRRVVHELRPPALDQLGLVSALRAHAGRLSAGGGGLEITVVAPEPFPELPAAVEVAAYRIALEAMTNVSRHAHARACRVELDLGSDLRLVVADDGVGLAPGCEAGVGLASMHERAAELGGRTEIRAREGGGTVVVASLPIGAAR
jgi:signal transduction histidine kinase